MVCKQCQSPFEVTPEELALYKKFNAEPTGLCFNCDQKNRLCFRNERVLYNRKCDATGDAIISIYSSDKPYKVYKSEAWYGDAWDGTDFGMEVDFSRPFFEQLKELQLKVPRLALVNVNGENSDYCNMCTGNKNCYLVFGGDFNQDVYYGTLCMNNKSSMDIDLSGSNELCYMIGDSANCYGSHFVFDSKNCRDCHFVGDCDSCTDCILCTNLSHKSYCIENQQYSKEEYMERKKAMLMPSANRYRVIFDRFLGMHKARIVKYTNTINCQNCSGDYIYNSKNCHNSYNVYESEDLRNVILSTSGKDCFNSCLLGHKSELLYDSIAMVGAVDCQHSYAAFNSSGLLYCDFVFDSQDCFGCVGLRRKRCCILNKPYSKEEYAKLKSRLIEHMKKTGEWGRFLPKELSCFGYDESTAQQYFPLSKESALAQGYQWKGEDSRDYRPATSTVPNSLEEVPDHIVDEILACERCSKNYKIIPQELAFYRQNQLPAPNRCSECRHRERSGLRNPYKLWARQCAKCKADIQTTYAPDRPEIVYCEKCYLEEVY